MAGVLSEGRVGASGGQTIGPAQPRISPPKTWPGA
jgi:hypothetical protein